MQFTWAYCVTSFYAHIAGEWYVYGETGSLIREFHTHSAYDAQVKENFIKAEIMRGGPVVISLSVMEDAQHYRKGTYLLWLTIFNSELSSIFISILGVYQHVTGAELYPHAVKVIGWGIERATEYWIVSNSFGTNWGEYG